MKLSIIAPAFNEEDYLGPTLDSIRIAVEHLSACSGVGIEIVVDDNNSEDDDDAVARGKGTAVVGEPVRGILRARNTGARHAKGDVLVFVDADVIVPRTLLDAIHTAMSNPVCVGGGVDVENRPRRPFVRLYLRSWRLLANRMEMVQGATQFCRRDVFEQVGGYDEGTWIGEDIDFYWGLRKLAKETNREVRLIRNPRVRPSCRRFDKWPLWRTLVWTNPLFIALFRRWKEVWGGWYSDAVR